MEITSRFTLYDLLAMVFPGCFIIFSIRLFIMINNFGITLPYFTKHELLYYTAFFVLSYLIGIGWNTLNGWLWRKFVKSISESRLKRELARKGEFFKKQWNALSEDGIIEQYKCAYAYVQLNDTNSTINIVESQISMLSNMSVPIGLWGGAIMYINNFNLCSSIIGGLAISLLLFALAIIRQTRLYHLVCAIFLRLKRYENIKPLQGAETKKKQI